MRIRVGMLALSSLLAGVTVVSYGSPARSITLTDTYYGGTNTYPGSGDVISSPGDSTFNVDSADVTRNGDKLDITIHTMYAGAPGTDGTGYGSLFLTPGPDAYHPSGGGGPNFPNDTYNPGTIGQPGQFQYVFTMPQFPASGSISATPGALFSVGNFVQANAYAGT